MMRVKWLFGVLFWALNLLAQQALAEISADRKWLQNELQRMHLPKPFIADSLDTYDPASIETVLRLNLLGFLHPPQHMDLVTETAVTQCKEYTRKYSEEFKRAEKKYGVSPSVVSALMWVETQHGKNSGDFHVVSVYLDLLQAGHKKNLKELIAAGIEKNKKLHKYSPRALTKLITERVRKKSLWAKEQIRALSIIYRKNQIDLETLQGSFAGAFGIPQFLPASYLVYAKAAEKKVSPDLYKPSDAIMSVAYYLKKNGWKNARTSSKVKSLMNYNNSEDYADSILEISRQAEASALSKNRRISSFKEAL